MQCFSHGTGGGHSSPQRYKLAKKFGKARARSNSPDWLRAGTSALCRWDLLRLPASGISPGLGLAIAGQEKVIIGDGFFDELLQQKQFRTVDHRVNALLEGLHRREGLKRVTEQNH